METKLFPSNAQAQDKNHRFAVMRAEYFLIVLNTSASKWEELRNDEKQWCLRWWYAVNIYKVTTRRGGYFMLPGCMTQRIQRAFPLRSNNGSFN